MNEHPDRAQVLEAMSTVTTLPALPVVVQTVLRNIDADNSHLNQIARLIGHDQAITARILRLANSPFYATREPIRTISQAVPLLGLRTINAILFKTTLFDAFQRREARGFWLHALGVACATRAVARLARLGRSDETFAIGLLHDVGKLALEMAFPASYTAVRATVKARDCLIREAEAEIFGCDHAEAGQALTARWSLPTDYTDAIGCHHALDRASDEGRPWAACVHLADITARAMLIGNGGDKGMPVLDEQALNILRLTRRDFETLFATTEEELGLSEVFFNVLDE